MAKLISAKCPQCDANLEFEDDLVTAFCPYCGAKILIESKSIKVVHKYYHDIAKEKDIESKERLAHEEIKIEENKRKRKTHAIVIYAIICAIMLIVSFIHHSVYNDSLWSYLYLTTFIVITLPWIVLSSRFVSKHGGDSIHSHETRSGFLGLHKDSSESVTTATDKAIAIWIVYLLIIAGWIFIPKIMHVNPLSTVSSTVSSTMSDMWKRALPDDISSAPTSPSAAYISEYYQSLSTNNSVPPERIKTNYMFLFDKWHLYVATILSTSQVQIKAWYRSDPDEKFVFDHDVCIINIEDNDYNFNWIDNTYYTSFVITLVDIQNRNWPEYSRIAFSEINSSNNNWEKDGASSADITYSYQYDKWTQYRAVQLSNEAIKIECWEKIGSKDTFSHSYDLCTVNPNISDTSFSWADDNHTMFSLKLHDAENPDINKLSLVTFVKDE